MLSSYCIQRETFKTLGGYSSEYIQGGRKMSLTNQQKHVIRKIRMYAYSDIEREGKAYYADHGKEKEFIIPQFGEILKKMFDNIKKAGFTEIERCSPSKANCIIRIYQDLHHEYEWGLCFNIYGANCYTNINGIWETSDGIDNYPIEYDRHQFRMILMPDESLRVNADFVDCYVKIA